MYASVKIFCDTRFTGYQINGGYTDYTVARARYVSRSARRYSGVCPDDLDENLRR